MKALPFLPLLGSSAILLSAVAQAGPLQFELGPPLPPAAASGEKKPAAAAQKPPGEIRNSEPGADESWRGVAEELWQGERKICSGRKIGGRSFSGKDPATATWVVSLDPMPGPSQCDGPPTMLMLVPLHGEPRYLTHGGMMATAPLISPDGATVAFTAGYWFPGLSPDPQFIFLCDVASGETICVSGEDGGSGRKCHHATACSWSADSRTLTFSQSWQEDGSAEVLRTVTLQPADHPSQPLKFELGQPPDREKGEPGEDAAAVPGEVRQLTPAVAELWQGDRKILSAQAIGRRSYSGGDPATGTWVVAAVTGDRPPLGDGMAEFVVRDGRRVLDASPSEVHLIMPDGASRRISLPHTDATSPLISPDGSTVAFVSSPVFEDGSAGVKKLYVYDVASNELTYAASSSIDMPGHGVAPFAWSPDSRTLLFHDYEKGVGGPGSLRTLTLLPKE